MYAVYWSYTAYTYNILHIDVFVRISFGSLGFSNGVLQTSRFRSCELPVFYFTTEASKKHLELHGIMLRDSKIEN